MNIGIIVTPFIEEEINKVEVINIDLINKIEKDCYVQIPDKYKFIDNKKTFVSSDIMIINYLKCIYNDVNINILNPLTLTNRDLEQNDLNFILTYDVIEAFHTLPYNLYLKYKNTIYNAKNMYPNIEFQKFISYKSIYYSYLKEKNINIQDFYIIYNTSYYEKELNDFFKYKEDQKWDNYVLKPLYGQESIGVSFIKKNMKIYNIQQKVEKIFYAKFPGLIFQKEIKKYLKNNILKEEFRVYFIGEKYMYMTSEIWNEATKDNNYKVNIENTYQIEPSDKVFKIIDFAKNIIGILPKIIINDINLKYLLLRIDITYDNDDNLIISEIEYVPSLHVDLFTNDKMKSLHSHQVLGDNIVLITQDYLKKRFDKIDHTSNNNNHIILVIFLIIFIYLLIILSISNRNSK